MRTRPPRHDERGAIALEAVLVIPALLLVVALVVSSARLWSARSTVQESAAGAARAATLAGEPGAAVVRAREVGTENLADLDCVNSSVSVDASALHRPPGVPGVVKASVQCRVPWADLVLPGLPGSILVTAEASSVADTYRSR